MNGRRKGKMVDGGTSTRGDESPIGRRQALARWCHQAGLLRPLRSLRGIVSRHDLRILAYHRVLESANPPGFAFDVELISATADEFREQMRILRKHYSPMSFEDALDRMDRGRSLPKNAVLVTFDDGYDDNYQTAFPILRELGMSAMFFVSTGHIESGMPYAFDWFVHMICHGAAERVQVPELELDWALEATLERRREQAAELLHRMKALDANAQDAIMSRLEQQWDMPRTPGIPQCQPMNWDQLREMRAAGMEIGSHGVDHRMLAKLPKRRMIAEVVESKHALERELGESVIALSYPVGGPDAYDADTIDAVSSAGYRAACSYISAVAAGYENRYALPRLSVERQMDRAWFEARLAVPELFAHAPKHRIG